MLLKGSTVLTVLPQSVAQDTAVASEIDHTVAPPPYNRKPLKIENHPWNVRKVAIAQPKKTVRIQDVTEPISTLRPDEYTQYKSITAKEIRPPERIVAPRARTTEQTEEDRDTTLLAVVDQPDITENHKEIADDIMREMPSQCLYTLKDFHVKYQKPKNRGLAGETVIILDGTVPDSEFRALFIHEYGHVIDLGCLKGTASGGKTAFYDGSTPIYADDPSIGFYEVSWINSTTQRSNTTPNDFVSGYASYDPFEDFAESFIYFVLHNEEFKQRARENDALNLKYRWFQHNLFPEGVNVAQGKSTWTGRVPWDITKLAYVWKPVSRIASND